MDIVEIRFVKLRHDLNNIKNLCYVWQTTAVCAILYDIIGEQYLTYQTCFRVTLPGQTQWRNSMMNFSTKASKTERCISMLAKIQWSTRLWIIDDTRNCFFCGWLQTLGCIDNCWWTCSLLLCRSRPGCDSWRGASWSF